MTDIETGIHSYAVSMVLTAKEYCEIQKIPNFVDNGSNYFSNVERYCSRMLDDKGIKIYLSKHGSIYTLKIRLEPCRILDSDNPIALYKPTKSNYLKMYKAADKLLKPFHVPRSIDNMKICRLDCTVDLYLSDGKQVLEYIRALQKGCVLPGYKRDKFKESEHKAKDIKEANSHSCRQHCKSAVFFAYDKTAQLQMTDRVTECIVGKNVLRLEAELERPAMKMHLNEQDNNYHFLKSGSLEAANIICWYIKRVSRKTIGTHVTFAKAKQIVQDAVLKEKTKEQLIYLLRKTSDSNLEQAMKKTRSKFSLSLSQHQFLSF